MEEVANGGQSLSPPKRMEYSPASEKKETYKQSAYPDLKNQRAHIPVVTADLGPKPSAAPKTTAPPEKKERRIIDMMDEL